MSKLWGGRFEGKLDPFFEDFNRSLGVDVRLLVADLHGSIAWARALGGAGVLTSTEVKKLTRALKAMLADIGKGDPFTIESDAEDIHSWVEQELGKKVGELARKLHTGRSRNDQVATDLKLTLHAEAANFFDATTALMAALVDLAEAHADLPIPGYTHLQRAQPITVGHHALAYVEMLERDRDRLHDLIARMDSCPLGSAALAGCAFKIDRRALAKELGFTAGPTRNSLDAVSDRDHVLEFAFCCSTVMLHLSRLAEDYIFFASAEAGFAIFSDAVATGSSLMPQKKNPDAMELIRGKAGRTFGALQSLMVTMKGLPLAYNKDMQEDKEPLFDAINTTVACLTVAATAVSTLTFDAARCRAAASQGYLNATDLADLLVQAGIPFRDAHERAGQAVRRALELGVEIEDLPDDEQRSLFPEITMNLETALKVDKVLGRRKVIGGTAPARVRQQVRSWQKRLQA